MQICNVSHTHECETWSLSYKRHTVCIGECGAGEDVWCEEEENLTGNWRKFHSKEPNDVYSVLNYTKAKRMRLAKHVARIGKKRSYLI